jgi:hypothetical protein
VCIRCRGRVSTTNIRTSDKPHWLQAEVTQNHENEHVRRTGQGEARHRKYKKEA